MAGFFVLAVEISISNEVNECLVLMIINQPPIIGMRPMRKWLFGATTVPSKS